MRMGFFEQDSYSVRCDWGLAGARATTADVAVVIDVLSFSTSVTIAMERGIRVWPYPWKDSRAAAFADSVCATLAVGRLEATKLGGTASSLSPHGLLHSDPCERLVLPSPNGSTICHALAETGKQTVLIGCLRNAKAVAAQIDAKVEEGKTVALIAAGERWESDDSLRPCLEDQLGAGAIMSYLDENTREHASPEALAALAIYNSMRGELNETLHSCVGGRELAAIGFAEDVNVAADLNASTVVPIFNGEYFS